MSRLISSNYAGVIYYDNQPIDYGAGQRIRNGDTNATATRVIYEGRDAIHRYSTYNTGFTMSFVVDGPEVQVRNSTNYSFRVGVYLSDYKGSSSIGTLFGEFNLNMYICRSNYQRAWYDGNSGQQAAGQERWLPAYIGFDDVGDPRYRVVSLQDSWGPSIGLSRSYTGYNTIVTTNNDGTLEKPFCVELSITGLPTDVYYDGHWCHGPSSITGYTNTLPRTVGQNEGLSISGSMTGTWTSDNWTVQEY